MSDLATELDPFIAKVLQHWAVPGMSVAVIRRDGPVLVRAYGVRSVETSISADADTAFGIGSCSKAFTSALAAVLVDAGAIAWDDPIRKYLPSFELYDTWISDHVTLRDLLANRTGLSRASAGEYGSDLSRAEILFNARHIQPVAGFRDQFTYSNIGYAAAAEAMALSVGHPFERILDDYLLTPLGLRPGYMSRAGDNIAAPHYPIEGKVRAVTAMFVDNLFGALGQTMSAREAATWLRFHLAEGKSSGVGSSRQIKETHLLQTARRDRTLNDGYGLGWHVRNRRIQHDGSIRGFRANIWCDMAGDLAIFVATNLGSGFAHFAVTNRIIQLMRGEAVTDWITHFDEVARKEFIDRVSSFNKEKRKEPVSTSRWSQEEFVGTYRHEGFGLLHIEPKDNHLWFRIDGLSGFDGPLMRFSSMGFEYQGERDAMALARMAVASPPQGERARLRFQSDGHTIQGLTWDDWFGSARFVRT